MGASRTVSFSDGKDLALSRGTDQKATVEGFDPPSSLVHGDSLGIDEASRLEGLATGVRDQEDLERDINRQVRCCMQYVKT